MKSGTLIEMNKLFIFTLFFVLIFNARSELLKLDEVGDLALSTDSIEIKNRNGKKLVQGVIYGFDNGIKKSMAQFIVTCGDFGGSIHIKGYDQDGSIWVRDGTSRADFIGKTACSMQAPEINNIPR
jgi:hypothetical protein